MPTRIVILGAGFGGLELSTRLAQDPTADLQVTLIDRNDSFVFGFAKLDVMLGERTPAEVRHPYRDITTPGVDFRRETVRSIDPEHKRVVTDAGTYDADVLVVALGAEVHPELTPGLVEGGHEFYTPGGAARLGEVLPAFEGGRIVIAVLGPVLKCPPAPYEAAFLLHERLGANATIQIVSPLPRPIGVSAEASEAILSLLAERGIQHWAGARVVRIDPKTNLAFLEGGQQLPYDLFLGVPVHRPPAVVLDSPLADGGWIEIDPATFATRFPDVYAVGDVTMAPVPKAGVFAEGEAATVADVLVARLAGGPAPPPYEGEATCFMATGPGRVAGVSVTFLSGASPTARFRPPSPELAEEKRRFTAARQHRWFGR